MNSWLKGSWFQAIKVVVKNSLRWLMYDNVTVNVQSLGYR